VAEPNGVRKIGMTRVDVGPEKSGKKTGRWGGLGDEENSTSLYKGKKRTISDLCSKKGEQRGTSWK